MDRIYINNYKWNNLLQVGISETIRTQKKIIKSNIYNNKFLIKYKYNLGLDKKSMSTLIINEIIKDNHNNEISLKFKQWFAGITDGDVYIYINKHFIK